MPGRLPLGSEPPRRARPCLARARSASPARALTQPQRATARLAAGPGRDPAAPARRRRSPPPGPRARTGPASPGKEDAGLPGPARRLRAGKQQCGRCEGARRAGGPGPRASRDPLFLGAQRWGAPGSERARSSLQPWEPWEPVIPAGRPAGAQAVLLAPILTPGGVSCCVQASSSPFHWGPLATLSP